MLETKVWVEVTAGSELTTSTNFLSIDPLETLTDSFANYCVAIRNSGYDSTGPWFMVGAVTSTLELRRVLELRKALERSQIWEGRSCNGEG
ncbi:MAG: hypothetical protein VYB72_01985 [Planctomycetota bacterium]|nr:hypothetical protein [Planctomycetota bacterium]